jgi:hypothetical protein
VTAPVVPPSVKRAAQQAAFALNDFALDTRTMLADEVEDQAELAPMLAGLDATIKVINLCRAALLLDGGRAALAVHIIRALAEPHRAALGHTFDKLPEGIDL